MTRYEITIDEIVVEGLPLTPADLASFRAATIAALMRLAGGHRGGWTGGEANLLVSTRLDIAMGASAATLGERVAGSVWHAIAPSSPAAGRMAMSGDPTTGSVPA